MLQGVKPDNPTKKFLSAKGDNLALKKRKEKVIGEGMMEKIKENYVSLCPKCNCMTKTTGEGNCGKCGSKKEGC